MQHSKTSEDIETEILNSSDQHGDLRIRQLIRILADTNHEIIVEGVIKVMERTNRPDKLYNDQEFAGRVLESIKPKTQMNLSNVLNRTIKNWDKSVKQFPFWLRDNYGLDKVIEVLDRIEVADKEKEKIETIKWWLHLK